MQSRNLQIQEHFENNGREWSITFEDVGGVSTFNVE